MVNDSLVGVQFRGTVSKVPDVSDVATGVRLGGQDGDRTDQGGVVLHVDLQPGYGSLYYQLQGGRRRVTDVISCYHRHKVSARGCEEECPFKLTWEA